MKNKKILAVMLAMAMLLLCACSNSSNGAANNGGAANSGNDAQVEANNGGETAEDAGDAGETETSTPAAPAEFDDHDGVAEFLNVGQCLDEDGRLPDQFFHFSSFSC